MNKLIDLKAVKHIPSRIVSGLGSRRFYFFVLGFFVFESVWIAFSALYPQAFDENFHFGLIKIYSHYWLPFLSHQPPGASAYGAVAHDPSYLYHYLLSFPYRLLALFVHSQTAQVIIFRLINIGLLGIGLALFKRVLERVGLSRGLANVSLLLFVLIPIVPQLAAQISYDNLLFTLVAWTCLLTFKVTDGLKKRKPSASLMLTLLAVCIFSSLVKYAFLPIFLTIVLFLAAVYYRTYKYDFKVFFKQLAKDFAKQSKLTKFLLPALVLLSIGMFMQRDGVNLVKYHNITPDCATVLSIQECSSYSPWYFNYTNHQQVVSGSLSAPYNIKVYTKQWFYWMWYRLFFAVNGLNSNYISYPPLPIPGAVAWMVALVGLMAVIWWYRRIFANPYIVFMLAVCVVYSVILFAKGYHTYKYTSVLENMNGRYLLPILPLFVAMVGLALSQTFQKWRAQKVAIALLVLVLFLQGGGLLNFILRSDESWYWPNHAVSKVNNAARKITSPVILKNSKIPSSNVAPSFTD